MSATLDWLTGGSLPIAPAASLQPVTNQVTTSPIHAGRLRSVPDGELALTWTDLTISDRARRDSPGMACKRPGVRVPLAPLQLKDLISNTQPTTRTRPRGTSRGRRPHRLRSAGQRNPPDGDRDLPG